MGSAQTQNAVETASLDGVTILVLDDDENVRTLVKTWLAAEGARVTTAGTIHDGLNRLRETEFDLLLLDFDLPDGQGTEVCRTAKRDHNCAVLMMTAHVSPGTGRAAVEAGAERVLEKPFERSTVLPAVVDAHTRLREQSYEGLGSIHERVRYLERILDITREIATSRNLETVLDTALATMTTWLDAEGGSILLRHDDRLEFAHAVGPGRDALMGRSIRVNEGIAGWVIEHGRPIAVADVRKHPRFSPGPDAASGTVTRSVLAAPLQIGARIIGVIELVNKQLGSFVRADRLALESVGYTIGAAIENARAQRHLEERVRERTSELRAVNERLREAKDQMVQAEKMASLGVIAAGIAHEINNPIGFVSSNLNTLKSYSPAIRNALLMCKHGHDSDELARIWEEEDFDFVLDDLQTLVEESQEGIGRVAKIIQDLRQFSHTDDGSSLELTSVDDCVRSALTLLRNELKYSVDLHTDLGKVPEIYAYPGQLTQVLVNLIINAVHAFNGDHGTLHIRTGNSNGFAEIEVRDDGPGIPEEIVNRIYDPFFTTKEPGKGTGLGLAISYEIIQRHQGEIDVATEPGQGTTFTVRIPVNLERGD